MTDTNHGEIFSEDHVKPFLPPGDFKKHAQTSDDSLYMEAKENRLSFWAKMAEKLYWSKKWDQILDDSNPPYYKWFVNGKLNIAVNCLDRHVDGG
jgi:acetyl-CoA synthetase